MQSLSFRGPGFQINRISFLKYAFSKKPMFYRTGGWGPCCEIDSVDLIEGP